VQRGEQCQCRGDCARYTIARDSADLRTLWAQIEALDGRIKPADQYDALLETSRYLSHFTLWLLLHRREYGTVALRDAAAAGSP